MRTGEDPSESSGRPPVRVVAPDEKTAAIEFRKLVLKVPRDLVVGVVQTGRPCRQSGSLTWKMSRDGSAGDDLGALLLDELSSAGYAVVGDRERLFDDPHARRAEYVIAGVIRDVRANACYPGGPKHSGTAEASLTVDWQVFSYRSKSVVLKETTSGTGLFPGAVDEPGEEVISRAFVSAARGLAANARFHDLISGGGEPRARAEQAPIPISYVTSIARSTASVESVVSDSRMSVVTVLAGNSMGSGFVISRDGFLLTSQHVIGESRYVKVRFVTGREVNGDVVRADRVRDVALIKLENDVYPFLPLGQSSGVQPGADVFAIGTPLSENFAQTVTKGIVSGYGEDDGLRVLRSDVSIHQGNSGGPLLDRWGMVVGLSVSGYILMPDGVGVGLNSFIPIEEALSALVIQRRESR
ncbi:MAG: S1C family serine protease [Acidobacteria bacterium]|nr:S1C family serine protease [Acidobacteriota bacterium]